MPSKKFVQAVLLEDLELNGKIYLNSLCRLENAAAHWIAIGNGEDDGSHFPPIEIISHCVVCLSSAASITKMLYPCLKKQDKNQNIKDRADSLLKWLGNPEFEHLKKSHVRNSWEHLDERLNDALNNSHFKKHSAIHVASSPPVSGVFVSRHFDPKSMAIKFNLTGKDESFELLKVGLDVSSLLSHVNNAMKLLID